MTFLRRVFFVLLVLATIGVLVAGIVGVAGGDPEWWGPIVAASGMLVVLGTIMPSRFRTVGAVPAAVIVPGVDGETVLPTAVVVDADNVVRFVHETDNYGVRPDPATFLAALDELALS